MIAGVEKGHRYKMKAVHAHFPAVINLINNGRTV